MRFLTEVVAAVKRPVAETGQVQDRFAQRLAGHRAAVDAHSSEHVAAVDHGHALAEFRRGNRAFLPGGTAADHDQIIGRTCGGHWAGAETSGASGSVDHFSESNSANAGECGFGQPRQQARSQLRHIRLVTLFRNFDQEILNAESRPV